MEIKDYLHLYIGCQCQMMGQDNPKETFKLTGVSYDDTQNVWWAYFAATEEMYAIIDDVFPVLRKLSDMTEEECDKYGIAYLNGEYTKDCFEADATYGTTFKVYGIKSLSERVIQMCKDGWDVFGLIPAGLAIDKTSLKN